MVGRRITFLVIAAALALPAAASADTLVVPSTKTNALGERDGHFVWAREVGDDDRLAQNFSGASTDLNVTATPVVRTISVGDTRSGQPLVVYSRCVSGFGSCDLYEYNLETGAHGRVPGAATARCSEHSPSVSKGVIVFGRNGIGCHRGLYVERPGRRPRQLAGADNALATDIRGNKIAWVNQQILNNGAGPYYRLRIRDLRTGRSCPVFNIETESEDGGGTIAAVQLSGSGIYWAQTDDFEQKSFPARASGCMRGNSNRTPGLAQSTRRFGLFDLDSFAVDEAGAVYYGSDAGIQRMDDPVPF